MGRTEPIARFLGWKRWIRIAVGDERGGVAVEFLGWKRRIRIAVGDERGGVAVEFLGWKRRIRIAVGDKRGGVAVEFLGWKRWIRIAVYTESRIEKDRITKRMIDDALNGKYNHQSQKRKRRENHSFFHDQLLLGQRMRRSKAEGIQRRKTFRERNAVSQGYADPTSAKQTDYSGLYGDYARLHSESLWTIDLLIVVAGFSERAV
jgi:hypothetical protein